VSIASKLRKKTAQNCGITAFLPGIFPS
jgi:hypothetical protein